MVELRHCGSRSLVLGSLKYFGERSKLTRAPPKSCPWVRSRDRFHASAVGGGGPRGPGSFSVSTHIK